MLILNPRKEGLRTNAVTGFCVHERRVQTTNVMTEGSVSTKKSLDDQCYDRGFCVQERSV